MNTYQVTALYQGSEELAWGEGDSLQWAVDEVVEQVSEMFMYPVTDITLSIVCGSLRKTVPYLPYAIGSL